MFQPKLSGTELLQDVKGVEASNIRVHLGGGKVGREFEWFFSPEDLVPGDMLILLSKSCLKGLGRKALC